MKSFMQMLLASFGVLSLVLAGCSSTVVDEDAVVEDDSAIEDAAETEEAAEDAATEAAENAADAE